MTVWRGMDFPWGNLPLPSSLSALPSMIPGEPVECKKAKESVWEMVKICPSHHYCRCRPCQAQSTIVWICRVQKKREWVRRSLCSEGQHTTGRESVLTSVVLTFVFLCCFLFLALRGLESCCRVLNLNSTQHGQ
jgi:hypothetical protein